jgi:hypothetical protein
MKQVSNAIKSFVLSSRRHLVAQSGTYSKYLVVLLLAGVAIVGSSFQKENVLSSSQNEKQKKPVPLKAEFQLTSAVTQQGGALIINTTGTGQGTHIGRSSYKCDAVVDATGYIDHLVITAPDGSEIYADGKGAGPVIDPTTGDVFITYQSTITGGSGRFKQAAGSFTVLGHSNLNSPFGTASLEGTISY